MDGYMRIEGETPSGGDGSEVFYLDDEGTVVSRDKATRAEIHEYKNGELIASTYGIINGHV